MSYQSDMINGMIHLIEEKIKNASSKILSFDFLPNEIKNKHINLLQNIQKQLAITDNFNKDLKEIFLENERTAYNNMGIAQLKQDINQRTEKIVNTMIYGTSGKK